MKTHGVALAVTFLVLFGGQAMASNEALSFSKSGNDILITFVTTQTNGCFQFTGAPQLTVNGNQIDVIVPFMDECLPPPPGSSYSQKQFSITANAGPLANGTYDVTWSLVVAPGTPRFFTTTATLIVSATQPQSIPLFGTLAAALVVLALCIAGGVAMRT